LAKINVVEIENYYKYTIRQKLINTEISTGALKSKREHTHTHTHITYTHTTYINTFTHLFIY